MEHAKLANGSGHELPIGRSPSPSNLFDETRGLAGWEAVMWLLIAACAFALMATLVYSSGG
jgi:hypothetical protein